MELEILAPDLQLRLGTVAKGKHHIDHRLLCLLQGIREYGAIMQAAQRIRCGYSYAWTSINDAEEQLGFKLIERHGARGSNLTEQGEEFLKRFEAMVEDMSTYVDSAVERHFRDFEPSCTMV